MSTERDIIIERLEQKLAARDKEIVEMKEDVRESIMTEIEKRFIDKTKLRESTVDEIRMKFNEKVNEIIEMNKSLRDSLLEQKKSEAESTREIENRINRVERRLMELNSSYDGVMKELLDQKSIIQELTGKKGKEVLRVKQEIKEVPPKEEGKKPEKTKQKGEYIVADSYAPAKKKQTVRTEESLEAESNPRVTKRENVKEGVEVTETLRKR